MSELPTKDSARIDPDQTDTEDGLPVIKIIIPKALQSSTPGQPWQPGTPTRLLSGLAFDHFFEETTLTREQLAELVELFKDEPLPETLRAAVVADLKGDRSLKQGRKKARQTPLEQVELAMLPAAYDIALEDAVPEHERLKEVARNQPRRAPVMKIPTKRAVALELVRKRLPSLKGASDRYLCNLISDKRGVLKGEDETSPSNADELKSNT